MDCHVSARVQAMVAHAVIPVIYRKPTTARIFRGQFSSQKHVSRTFVSVLLWSRRRPVYRHSLCVFPRRKTTVDLITSMVGLVEKSLDNDPSYKNICKKNLAPSKTWPRHFMGVDACVCRMYDIKLQVRDTWLLLIVYKYFYYVVRRFIISSFCEVFLVKYYIICVSILLWSTSRIVSQKQTNETTPNSSLLNRWKYVTKKKKKEKTVEKYSILCTKDIKNKIISQTVYYNLYSSRNIQECRIMTYYSTDLFLLRFS